MKQKFYFVLVAVLLLMQPDISSAAPLVTCDGTTANPCNLCALMDMGNRVLQWLIAVLLVVFSVIIVISGFGLATSGGNPAAKSAAKSKILNAIIGLVIVLAAWLLIDNVMRALLDGAGGTIDGRFWATISCS